jgi:dienelactone hydrolase
MKSIAAVLVVLAFASVPAAEASHRSPVEYRNPTVGRELALQVPGMHQASVRRNVVYSRGLDEPLRLDVYRPRGAALAPALPAVFLVHGRTSFGSLKDRGSFVGWGQLLAARGLAAITFNHTGTERDVLAAVATVRRRAGALGIDSDRLCLVGFSAGVGHAYYAILGGVRARCLVGFYGAPASERTKILKIPSFFAKAARDAGFLNDGVDSYVARARKARIEVRSMLHPRGLHGFDYLNHDRRSRQILGQAVEFMQRALQK